MRSAIQELRLMIELGLPRIQIDWSRWPKYWIAVAEMDLRHAGYASIGMERGSEIYAKKEPSLREGKRDLSQS